MLLQHTAQVLSMKSDVATVSLFKKTCLFSPRGIKGSALPGGDGRLVSVLTLRDAEVIYDCKVTVVSSEPVFIHLPSSCIPAMPLASVNYPEFKAFACFLQQGRPKA